MMRQSPAKHMAPARAISVSSPSVPYVPSTIQIRPNVTRTAQRACMAENVTRQSIDDDEAVEPTRNASDQRHVPRPATKHQRTLLPCGRKSVAHLEPNYRSKAGRNVASECRRLLTISADSDGERDCGTAVRVERPKEVQPRPWPRQTGHSGQSLWPLRPLRSSRPRRTIGALARHQATQQQPQRCICNSHTISRLENRNEPDARVASPSPSVAAELS